MKLRKNARYFVINGGDRFAKLIPLTYRYAGRHLCEAQNKMMHLFLVEGDFDRGVYVGDDELQGVEEFSEKRQNEMNIAVDYYNDKLRVPLNEPPKRWTR